MVLYDRDFARFYDLIYDRIRTGVDHSYYLQCVEKAKGRVLEIGCGTGRLMVGALEMGADMYGIDVSPYMLDILKIKLSAHDRRRISLQNAVNFTFDDYFSLIIAPFRVFSHLLTIDDQVRCLNNVAAHLTGNGRFIFDVFIPDPKILADGYNRFMDFEGEFENGKIFRRYVSSVSDIVNQLTHISWDLEWDGENGLEKKSWDMPFRFFFRYELEHLISLSELVLLDSYGDFEQNPLEAGSREMIMVCGRAG